MIERLFALLTVMKNAAIAARCDVGAQGAAMAFASMEEVTQGVNWRALSELVPFGALLRTGPSQEPERN